MTRISPSHPRYRSLLTRARLADDLRSGLVVPEGLIAHGRAEAFDYLLGERTSRSARSAIRAAARWLAAARYPVLSVNGNVAALAAPEVVALAQALPRLEVEINLFHRTARRVTQIAGRLRSEGLSHVRGLRPTGRLPGLPSDRARVDRQGIERADVVIVPLEDGDRAAALKIAGKRVIAIDLNPLSRTSVAADIPIVDDVVRALQRLAADIPGAVRRSRPGRFAPFDPAAARRAALDEISRRLAREAARRRPRAGPARPASRSGARLRSGTGRRTRRRR